MTPLERPETLALVWPCAAPPLPVQVTGYSTRFALDRAAFEKAQEASGWRVDAEQWSKLMTELVPGSMVFALRDGHPVGTACALARQDGWVELAWLGVAEEHRGRGLGAMLCAALTRHLLASGQQRLFGSTQDERVAALRIYLELGFHPVHRKEKVQRWRDQCARLGRPYDPRSWGWPLG